MGDNFLVTKECRTLKIEYKAAILLVALAIFSYIFSTVHTYLSLNREMKSNVLIVEGWLPDYALEATIKKFETNHYTQIYTTGGPLSVGSYLKEYKDYAHLAKASLVAMGMKDEDITAVAAEDVKRDRTYHSALALKRYLQEHNQSVEVMNLTSLGPHARRSTMLFQKAFGGKVKIGSIAIEHEDYDASEWYASSAGVRTTINEAIAYLYIVLLK